MTRAMKRSFEAAAGGPPGGPPKAPRTVGMAIKMLVSPKEAGTLIGKGGTTQKLIAESTGCRLHLSGFQEYYPGTELQEVCIKGDDSTMVMAGILAVLNKLSEETGGKVMGGEWDVEEGGARVHYIVPTQAARGVIGKGGENVKTLREASGMKVHVEDIVLGQGDAAEQVVSFAGPLQQMQIALPMLLEKVEDLSTQPWFANWAFSCQSSAGKGGGKGKGGMSISPMNGGMKGDAMKGKGGKGGMAGMSSMGNMGNMGNMGSMGSIGSGMSMGMDYGKGKGKSYGGAANHSSIDMLSNAVSALPPSLASDRSQVLQFNCAMGYVSALIGKGGQGTKQIAVMTDTKIMIREIEGNTAEKAVVIRGSAINVASAYLHLAGRVAHLMATMTPDAPGQGVGMAGAYA